MSAVILVKKRWHDEANFELWFDCPVPTPRGCTNEKIEWWWEPPAEAAALLAEFNARGFDALTKAKEMARASGMQVDG